MLQSREAVYSVEHFYPKHPEHPIAPLTADFHSYFREEGIEKSHLRQKGKLPKSHSVEQVLRNEPAMEALAALGFGDQSRGGLFIMGKDESRRRNL